MESEDGTLFVRNLAYFVRTHERALANALQLHREKSKDGKEQRTTAPPNNNNSAPSTSTSLTELLSRPYFSLSTPSIKPAKLTLTPHHLFFLLSKFEDLGVDVGPMTVRLENLHGDVGPMNYVSFLGNAPKSKGRQADTDSIKSTSSMRSVMSTMSSVWSAFTSGAAKAEKHLTQYRDDLKYLYSCFTKIPALRLAPDHRARLIAGFEEFPFDTAVPLFAFKNVSVLEISDLDFRQFHGWDRLAEQLRSLSIKRGGVDDPIDLLQGIVLDDAERRRKRSSKAQIPTTPSTPGVPWPSSSPKPRNLDLARSLSSPHSPWIDQRRSSIGSPIILARGGSADGKRSDAQLRQASNSPPRPETARTGSAHLNRPLAARVSTPKSRRESGSSGSSTHESTPRHSTPDLSLTTVLPSSKWRFLRHLSLAENGLTHIFATSLAPVAQTLYSLDLSGNLFFEIPEALASLTHLRALNLSNCMIDSLQSLSRNPIPAITTLNLRANRLLSLAGIERLYSLERLDLRGNRLHDPTELARLTRIPDISDLYVLKNPFTRTHSNYRVTIFNLFRSTPGHVEDVTIDTLGPIYNERKYLVDRAPEPSHQKPVVRPPMDDEVADEPPVAIDATSTADRLAAGNHVGHRRAASDFGPQIAPQRKKTPRRRIVELTQAEFPKSPGQASLSENLIPALVELPPTPYAPKPGRGHMNTLEPMSRELVTSPTQEPPKRPLTVRPKLDAAFEPPSQGRETRELSAKDSSSVQTLPELDPDTNVYRQKIEILKDELGPTWLSALQEERFSDVPARDRSFSPSSRASTVRAEQSSRGVSIGGRTLG